MSITKSVFIVLLLFLSLSCGKSNNESVNENLSLNEQIDQYIENNEYETALILLNQQDREDPEVKTLLEKTHLNYGLHSMGTFDAGEMRTRMNNALVQFTEVLKINPDNIVAREQIEQIMSVYSTMPDRSPDPEVLEGLREIGMNY